MALPQQVVIHHPRCHRSVKADAECTMRCAQEPVALTTAADRRTMIVVTSQRIVVSGHSSNKAACIAVTAAVQTAARIANRLGVLEEAPRLEEGEKPLYDVYMRACEQTDAVVAGAFDAFEGIESVVPGSLEIQDVRK